MSQPPGFVAQDAQSTLQRVDVERLNTAERQQERDVVGMFRF